MQNLQVIEVRGIRVLTTKQLAEAYGTDVKTIQYNFRYNKSRYIHGKHYIEVVGEELRKLKTRSEFHSSLKYAKSLYLWTEKGALLHAKSLNTDKAWEVYDYLVDFYFKVKEEKTEILPKVPTTLVRTEEEVKDSIFKFKILLQMAEEMNITVKQAKMRGYYSRLEGDKIILRSGMSFETTTYELAYELAHAFVHYNKGNLIDSPLSKYYNDQAERVAKLMLELIGTTKEQLN